MRRIFAFFVVLLLLAVAGGAGIFYYANHPGPLEESAIFLIEPGDGFAGIADRLARENIISFPLVLKAWTVLQGKHHDFKAGEFELEKNVTPNEVVDILVGGKSIQHSVTVPEGLISADILNILRDAKLLKGDVPASLPEASLLP